MNNPSSMLAVTYEFSFIAFTVFALFVGSVLGLSFYLGRKAKSAKGYYAAHGQINWFVNGVAFAGDYLSAASFLGICGMIAFFGYDGFLYSIGFLAGWVVALFVIAEPLKRMGKFTFADALDAKFNSRGIKLAAAISTLLVSIFYLIPQMVGAGKLIVPLLNFPYWSGVVIVGSVVILIVATAGMVSTTYVQFIKGSLLVIFCFILTISILFAGLKANPNPPVGSQQVVQLPDGRTSGETGPLGPLEYIHAIQESKIAKWKPDPAAPGGFSKSIVSGSDLLQPGGHPYFAGVRSDNLADKLEFMSLMLALFCGTASLPHILIRYYTVKDGAAARKSTVVGIATIGFFYVLTLFLGLGAMVCGGLDPKDATMSAPLLARTFNIWLFAIISAIAFTTVLGTVSGLIIAASGAVAHDLMSNFLQLQMTDHQKVRAGKIVAVVVGVIAMLLGIAFEEMNPAFLVGWAFNVAASANLPALIMLLFWKRTTKQGITASILVGLLSSLAWLLLSDPAFKSVYHANGGKGLVPFSDPGIITIPFSFFILVVVSLFTSKKTTSEVVLPGEFEAATAK